MRTAAFAVVVIVQSFAFVALAQEAAPPAPPAEDPAVAQAREAFLKGGQLAKDAQWAEALAAFEQSAALRPHPITTYNIGACQRSLGRYTLARKTLGRALAEDRSAGNVLSPA